MRYYALATDYDGTLATHGRVDAETLSSLERLRNSGRKLILVTGRELDELIEIFPRIEIFERVVAENGALIYNPHTKEEVLLAEKPPETFIEAIRKSGIGRFSVGRCIVAAWKPDENILLDIIREHQLELQIIFNKDAVMVLPSGINKAAGLVAALNELKLSPHNVAGIGDAENDHAFLNICEYSAAVDNALDVLKKKVDLVTKGDHGKGVSELVEKIIENDLSEHNEKQWRHRHLIGKKENGEEVCIEAHGTSFMLAGTSGGGKSTFATSFIERLLEKQYQFTIIDPEGDYQELETVIMFGSQKQEPDTEEIIKLLENPLQNCSINLLGIRFEDRSSFFNRVLQAILELRTRTGRPHWVIVDEAHHLFPPNWDPADLLFPKELRNMVFITVHPDKVAHTILSSVDKLVAIGQSADETIQLFCDNLGIDAPYVSKTNLEKGEAIFWNRMTDDDPFLFRGIPPKADLTRHKAKYSEGSLDEDRSFYFRGPHKKLKLRAQNLVLFLQIGDGVDDETWMYHLHEGDYSHWIRHFIKDPELADEIRKIELDKYITPASGRSAIRRAIEEKYTSPA